MTNNVPGHMAASTQDMRLHQTMARGGSQSSGNFGVAALGTLSRGNGFSNTGSMKLTDASRGAGRPVTHTRGKKPAQAAPDHGPH